MKKHIIILAATAVLLVACDKSTPSAPAEKVIEKNRTIINPPAKEEKKVETNTTIIKPSGAPATEEKKTTTTIETKK